MKSIIPALALTILIACGKNENKISSVEFLNETGVRDSVFWNLISLTNNTIPSTVQQDSLAFLVLPVQASCPSCRKKTITSIVTHKDRLAPNHYIIISANGGRKNINSYFREEDAELPQIENRLFLDSTNQAYKYALYDDKPTMYYTHGGKAYKKVGSIPATVHDDLKEFFSGNK